MTDPPPILDRDTLLWYRRKLRTWAKTSLRDFPWRRTSDPYAILVAECLLQKTTAEAVEPVYTQFLDRYPDLPALLAPLGIRGERVKSRCKLLWAAADEAAPNRDVARWNLTLLGLGALVCTARSPRCEACPLAKRCRGRAGDR